MPDLAGREAAERILKLVQGLSRGRPGAVPDLGRRFGPAHAARARTHSAGQAGHQPRAAEERRQHRRDELRAQASVGDQGRPARGRLLSRQGGHAHDLGRAGRRSGRDRFRADGARTAPPSPMRWRFSTKYRITEPASVRGAPARSARGDAQARRSAAGRASRRIWSRRLSNLWRPRPKWRAKPAFTPLILGDSLEGESREVALVHAGIARQVLRHGQPAARAVRAAVGRRDHGDRAEARGAADATSSSCWRWRWRSTASPASTPWPATPTAWMAPKTMPAPWSLPTRSRARPRAAWTPKRTLPIMTVTASSPAWATWSRPAPRSPTSTTFAPS